MLISQRKLWYAPDYGVILGSHQLLWVHRISRSNLLFTRDLPISVDYFGAWWLEYVISQERDTYKFRCFMDDLLNSLLNQLQTLSALN